MTERARAAVFGSPRVLGDNVMLAVATSDVLVGPTRLLFPRAAGGVGEAAGFPFSLLGAPRTRTRRALLCGQPQRNGPSSGERDFLASQQPGLVWCAVQTPQTAPQAVLAGSAEFPNFAPGCTLLQPCSQCVQARIALRVPARRQHWGLLGSVVCLQAGRPGGCGGAGAAGVPGAAL